MDGRTFYVEIDGVEYKKETLDIITGKNLLLCLENDSYNQLLDTVNSNWVVKFLNSMADIEEIIKNYNKNKNIALIHHGNVYSATKATKDKRVVLDNKWLSEYIPKVYNSISEEEKKLDIDKLCDLLHEKSKTFYKDGLEKKVFIAYINLKLLIQSLAENGNYFSIACDEADDESILETIANLTDKKIKVYANSNFTTVNLKYWYPDKNPIIQDYGSILNAYLTTEVNWKDNSGWKYYDSLQKKIIITKKDLWLYSNKKTKVFDLLSREKKLTSAQKQKQEFAQMYFSKKFKKVFINRKSEGWGQEGYNQWKKQIELEYPDFKN